MFQRSPRPIWQRVLLALLAGSLVGGLVSVGASWIVSPSPALAFQNSEDFGHGQFSPDGSLFLATAYSPLHCLVRVWDVATGQPSFQVDLPSEPTFAPDGRIAFIDQGGRVVFLDPKTGYEQRTAVVGLPDIALLVFSPNVKQLATLEMQLIPGANERIVFRLWDLTSGKGHVLGDTLQDSGWLAAPMQFSADGRKLVAVCRDGTVRIWDTVTRKEERRYHIQQDGWDKRVHGGWLSPTLDKLVQTTSYVPLPRLEDVQQPRQTAPLRPVYLPGPCSLIESVTFTKQGRVLGTTSRTIGPPRQINHHFLSGFTSGRPHIYLEGWLEVWEIEGRGKLFATIADCHGGKVSPDGQWVVGTDVGRNGIVLRRWPLIPQRPDRAATYLPFVLAAAAGLVTAVTVWWWTGRSYRKAVPSG